MLFTALFHTYADLCKLCGINSTQLAVFVFPVSSSYHCILHASSFCSEVNLLNLERELACDSYSYLQNSK